MVVRTYDGPQKACLPPCLHTIAGSEYYSSMFPVMNYSAGGQSSSEPAMDLKNRDLPYVIDTVFGPD